MQDINSHNTMRVKFKNPPLREVAFSVNFETLKFSSVHFGRYWEMIKNEFPLLPEDKPPSSREEEVFLLSLPPLRKVWFRSEVQKNPEFLSPVQPLPDLESKTELTFFNNKELDLLKWYFQNPPNKRIKICKKVAEDIRTIEEILEILKWGNQNNVRDGYDGAIALLAECDGNLLAQLMLLGHTPYGQYINIFSPEQWEILIKSVACSQKIQVMKKYILIVGFMNNYNLWGRLVKSAIIDFFWIVEDELDDIELIHPILERFIRKDSDLYIRKYAQEALDDIS
ncbi:MULTISPECIES: hypothetical protein [Spirulina sp. CCY15215]|uniref:hypothetical protein n=1 Tax=Spirulina sp. CCY15215 TaxID=2767591 RepID=UPI0019502BD8|nr:hypothetical protein [Spirulina major]